MSGTLEGAQKAKATIRRKYGENYYRHIGYIGGTRSKSGGFAHKGIGKDGLTGKERARIVGGKGGKTSRKNKS